MKIKHYAAVAIFWLMILGTIALLMNGCTTEEENWGAKPFVEMETERLYLSEHYALCQRDPESIFCKEAPTIGDIKPTLDYMYDVLWTMNDNFKYVNNDSWIYNDNIYEFLKGDCEDIASTMAMQFYNDGVDTKHLYLVYRKISDTEAHMFLAVDTIDGGMRHLDYSNSGYPIEPQINFYMALDDPGVYKWVKGNIE